MSNRTLLPTDIGRCFRPSHVGKETEDSRRGVGLRSWVIVDEKGMWVVDETANRGWLGRAQGGVEMGAVWDFQSAVSGWIWCDRRCELTEGEESTVAVGG